jgi:alkylation response protein AidB-like acyl-CoA dehydrogenase
MDVRLSTEQQALRETAARVVNDLAPGTVAALDDRRRIDRLEAAVVESGWRQLRTDADDGGPLASGVEVAIVVEELGRGLADVAFLGPTLAAELRRLVGAVPAEASETVALDRNLSDVARAMGDETPAAVAIDAAGAVSALMLQPSSDGLVLAAAGLVKAETSLDLTRPVAALDTSVSLVRVGEPAGFLSDDGLTAWAALGLALTCADLVGVMRGAVELGRDYASHRRQYDAPIGSFQAVQHMLADAYVAMEGSKSVALHAAWAVDALGATEALAAADLAKAYCSRAARSVCETVIQVHGGIGNTWECLAHVYLRRALESIDLFGGAGASLSRVLVHHGIGAR